MSVVHLLAFLLAYVALAVVLHAKPRVLARRTRQIALFIGLLLLAGSLGNGLWSCLVWDRLYDSTDYVFDFTPFWPITRRVIDAPWGDERGRLLGVSMFQLQLIWFFFAAGTWGSAAVVYRLVRKEDRPTSVAEATP
jgi:hypothetical protein